MEKIIRKYYYTIYVFAYLICRRSRDMYFNIQNIY